MGETSYAQYPSLRGSHRCSDEGGASGIGEAVVEAFAMQGATVAFLDIQDEAAGQLIRRLETDGCAAPVYFRCDLTDVNALQAVMQRIVSQFGTVDVLVNNAGNDTRHSIAEVTPDSWDRAMAINLKAQFFTIQSVIPAMQEAKRGVDHQHEFDRMGDPVDQCSDLCYGEGKRSSG